MGLEKFIEPSPGIFLEAMLSMDEIPDTPQELPDNPPFESPPFEEPGEPMYPGTIEPEPVQTPEPNESVDREG